MSVQPLVYMSALGCLLATAAAAQGIYRADDAFRLPFQFSGVSGEVLQSSGMEFAAVPGRAALWRADDNTVGFVDMPFDTPGSCLHLGGGSFLVSGLSSQSHTGSLVRLHLVATSPLTAVIDEVVSVGSLDPWRMVYDSVAGRLVFLDGSPTPSSKRVYMASWAGGPLPTTFALAYTVVRPNDPALSIRLPVGQESAGYYLGLVDVAASDLLSASRKLRLYEVSSGVWAIEDLSAPPGWVPVYAGWSIKELYAVPEHGMVELRNTTTLDFAIRDEATMSLVYFGQVSSLNQWESVAWPPLAVGGRYSLVDLASLKSKEFSPSFRLGGATFAGGYSMSRGYLNPLDMTVGNSEFSVDGRVRWSSDTVAAPSQDASVWVWAAIEEPGPQATVTLPTGEVILAHPIVAMQFPVVLPPDNLMGLRGTFQFPLPNDDGIAGVPVLFQLVAFLGNGAVVVSDVFGSRVLPSLSGPAQRSAAGAQLSMTERRHSARQWLQQLPCALPCGSLQAQVRHRLMTMAR